MLLQQTQIVGFGTGVFCGGEAKVAGALGLANDTLQRLQLLAFFSHTYQLQGVFGLGHAKEVGVGSHGLHIGAVGLL